jgi:hypothetical protein|nr:MAG TPA: hypothetical protein [Caudoviricetes sp.]
MRTKKERPWGWPPSVSVSDTEELKNTYILYEI